jgi:hypothetical protein
MPGRVPGSVPCPGRMSGPGSGDFVSGSGPGHFVSGPGPGDLMSGPGPGHFVSGYGSGVLSYRGSLWLSSSTFSARRILEGLGLRRLMRDRLIPIASATIE